MDETKGNVQKKSSDNNSLPSNLGMEESTLTTKEAYFASLEAWVKNANIAQNAMAMFPWYLMQMFHSHQTTMGTMGNNLNFGGVSSIPMQPQNLNNNVNDPQSQRADTAPNLPFGLRILDLNSQTEYINRNGGYEYVLAPFWKRVVAEIIDIALLFVFKILLTFAFMNFFDYDWALDLDKEVLRKALDDEDYANFFITIMDFFAFSTDLMVFEILMKLCFCVYEAYSLKLHGSTPGKAIMNLKVFYVEAVLPLQGPQQQQMIIPQIGFQGQRQELRALIFPAITPSFKRAFIRSICKHLILTLLFPMCLIMVFFKNNRAAYDIVTKTIVVEDINNRVLRRP